MTKPKVSIIIPVYGVERFIERCARSLFEQTLESIEYLFVDDCSPDDSISVLNRVLKDYPARMGHVVVHRMDRNSGQAEVRKWGMQNATGEFIIHCDSDDWVDPTMYEQLYNQAVEKGLDMVFCGHEETDCISTTKRVYRDIYNIAHKDLIRRVLTTDDLNSLCCCLIKKELVNDIVYPIGNLAEDKTIMIQLCLHSGVVGSIHEVYYHYYRRPDSITVNDAEGQIERKIGEVLSNVDIIKELFKKKNLISNNKNSYVSYIVYSHRMCLRSNNAELIRKCLYKLYRGTTKWFLFNPLIDYKFKIKIIAKTLVPRLLFT